MHACAGRTFTIKRIEMEIETRIPANWLNNFWQFVHWILSNRSVSIYNNRPKSVYVQSYFLNAYAYVALGHPTLNGHNGVSESRTIDWLHGILWLLQVLFSFVHVIV